MSGPWSRHLSIYTMNNVVNRLHVFLNSVGITGSESQSVKNVQSGHEYHRSQEDVVNDRTAYAAVDVQQPPAVRLLTAPTSSNIRRGCPVLFGFLTSKAIWIVGLVSDAVYNLAVYHTTTSTMRPVKPTGGN